MAFYAYILAVECGKSQSEANAIVAKALMHDIEESITGDLPFLVKRITPWEDTVDLAMRELCPDTEADEPTSVDLVNCQFRLSSKEPIVKIADALAAMIYAKEEYNMGNKTFGPIVGELVKMALTRSAHDTKLHAATKSIIHEFGLSVKDARDVHEEISHL